MKTSDRPYILIVGSGRLARHLIHWSQLLNLNFKTWNRSSSLSNFELLKTLVAESSHVWLALTDSAIVEFYEKHLSSFSKMNSNDKNPIVVHFSGALNASEIFSAHPLMTFGPELYSLEKYQSIHWALTEPNNRPQTKKVVLSDLMPGLTNSFFYLAAADKPFYHALCVLAGNIPQMIWSEVSLHFQNLNLNKEALIPYLKQVTENFITHNEKALTGPLVRQDNDTIEKNLLALQSNSVFLESLYKSTSQNFSVSLTSKALKTSSKDST